MHDIQIRTRFQTFSSPPIVYVYNEIRSRLQSVLAGLRAAAAAPALPQAASAPGMSVSVRVDKGKRSP